MKPKDLSAHSKNSLNQGSKSFSFASRFFKRSLQEDVAHLYSWCRWCDDVADGSSLGFHQNPVGLPGDRVEVLLRKSHLALQGKNQNLEPPFIAFGQVMRKYQVPWIYAEDLLLGMQHDVAGKKIETFEELLLYCYRVAGTVGLIMCHIMGLKSTASLKRAAHLGIALQLTNIVRDIGDDFRVSKVYLPETWLSESNIPSDRLMNSEYSTQLEYLAKRLLKEADYHYQLGLSGLQDLPWRCSLAVAIAACIYRSIGKRVLHQGYSSWLQQGNPSRVSIGNLDRMQACGIGFFLFLKTIPQRLLNPKPTVPIDQVWRYP